MTTIADIVHRREITEVLHFTTNHGLTGILAERAVLSRQSLPESKYLEHVYKPNASVRKDHRWLDHVNLSISRINTEFFGHSSRWHANRDVWWCALSFAPAILDHHGVIFATTNNIYSGCRRAPGPNGLEALFAKQIERWPGNAAERQPGMPHNWTTCHQAEVLYPSALSCDHLRRVYVATGPHADIAASTCEILLALNEDDPEHPSRLPVVTDASIFEP